MSKAILVLSLIVFATFVLILPGHVKAQKLEVTSVRMISTDKEGWVTPETSAGKTVSKKGAKVKFELEVDDKGKPSGYRFEEGALKALKTGEQIPLFIRNLKFTSSAFDPATDESGSQLLSTISYPSLKGAWKVVTIESVNQTGDEVSINVSEELKLEDGRAVRELRFLAKEGYLTDVTPSEADLPEKADQPSATAADTSAPAVKTAIPLWGWIAGGSAIVGLVILFALWIRAKNRRGEAASAEP